jgi:hypothetical protein
MKNDPGAFIAAGHDEFTPRFADARILLRSLASLLKDISDRLVVVVVVVVLVSPLPRLLAAL